MQKLVKIIVDWALGNIYQRNLNQNTKDLKNHLKMSGKWRLYCLGLNVLMFSRWQCSTLPMITKQSTCRLFRYTLRWRHNGRDGVSNHQPRHCLLNSLFGRSSKKTSKFRVTGLCAGNSPGTGEFPAQMASNAEYVSIWWRHHEIGCCQRPVSISRCRLSRKHCFDGEVSGKVSL